MRKKIIVFLLMAAFLAPVIGAGLVQAQGEDSQTALKKMLNDLDTSITCLRRRDIDDAKGLISGARSNYDENFSVENDRPDLHNEITQAFDSLSESLNEWASYPQISNENLQQSEEDVFVLRAKVSQAASLKGVSLSSLYTYSMFIILGITAVASLIITLLTKRLVNWDQVRENKAKMSEYLKELRAAQSKRDMKQIHKLQQRQAEIRRLQSQVFGATLKPTIIYIIPMILLFYTLTGMYSGWVVAWSPFNIGIPILAPEGLVAFGVGWWYILTYMGFSQIFRKILIRD